MIIVTSAQVERESETRQQLKGKLCLSAGTNGTAAMCRFSDRSGFFASRAWGCAPLPLWCGRHKVLLPYHRRRGTKAGRRGEVEPMQAWPRLAG
jgi:hypothetical protein